MKRYTLYLDENHIKERGHDYTTIAGIAIEENKIDTVNRELNVLKRKFFDHIQNPESIILHEVDINKAQYRGKYFKNSYKAFTSATTYKVFFKDLEEIILDSEGKIFGVTLKCSTITNWYPKAENTLRFYLYSMPLLMENFLHFLKRENALGKIVIESFNSDNDTFLVKQKFHHILANGTLFFDSKDYISHFESINIIKKTENNNLLQLADFLPNRFNKNAASRIEKIRTKNEPKHFYKSIKELRYDGGNNQPYRFGVKIIPKN